MRVLYIDGDDCSARYVQGVLRRCGANVERLDPGHGFDPRGFDAILLSDVEYVAIGEPFATALADEVRRGTGLLFAGGLQSFGRGGYAGSPIADVLPVRVADADDHAMRPLGAIPVPVGRHPLVEGLPFDDPPILTGYNRFTARGSAQTALEVADLEAAPEGGLRVSAKRDPLLVIGRREQGRVVAFAARLAPHRSGGLIDWGGPPLIRIGEREEVASHYVSFVTRLVSWVGRGELEPPHGLASGPVGIGQEADPTPG